MGKMILLFTLLVLGTGLFGAVVQKLAKDIIPTAKGDLAITFIGHGSLMFEFNGKVIHVDPVSSETDYSKLPQADLILVTHEHYDHLDLEALKMLRTKDTAVVTSRSCSDQVRDCVLIGNGEAKTVRGFPIEAVPAFNVVHKRPDGNPFHPKGRGNGYILTFGDKRIYIAGDTENIPDMKTLKAVDIAFLPMNLPYTMTPEMVAEAARAFRPKILYPYHFGDTDTSKLLTLLKDQEDIEVRIRDMR